MEVRKMTNSLKEQVISSTSELFSTSSCELCSSVDKGPKKGAWITLFSSLLLLSRGKDMLARVRLMKKLVALELVACCFTPEHIAGRHRNLAWGGTDGHSVAFS